MASASNPAASNPAAFNPAESNPATSKTAVFYIFHRDEEGKPDRLISYEEEGASYLLAATNICREVLDHETGRKALGTIATAFMKLHPHDGWTKRSTSAQVVDRFIQLIFDTFPWLFIDDGFPNQNISACHYRRKYDPFFTRHQAICLNGSVS